MGTDQPVILITYPDLGRCCLQDCRLSTMSVEYGIVVAVILDVKWIVGQNVKPLPELTVNIALLPVSA